MMKSYRPFFITILISICCTNIYASSTPSPKFVYGTDFEMNFDNREYYSSRFSNSMTIFGARLTPTVGLQVSDSKDFSHEIMFGIDIMKDFGASPAPSSVTPENSPELSTDQINADLFREILIYYTYRKKLGSGDFTLHAGIFPRKLSEGYYSRAFFSDKMRFYDNNIEGLLMTYKGAGSYFDFGCDWMGMYGNHRREKFMIFSSGRSSLSKTLSLGYSAYMYHFACSDDVDGVVDNILINPYISLDFGEMTGFSKFSFTAGYLQGLQHDRKNVGYYVFPFGGEFKADIRKKHIGLSNELFYGYDMMPYYHSTDKGGYKYTDRLYFGDPFYRIHDNGNTGPGIYDMVDVYWQKNISEFLDIRLSVRFHFHSSGYSGTQQLVNLRFNLQRLPLR